MLPAGRADLGGVDKNGKARRPFNSRGIRQCTSTAYAPSFSRLRSDRFSAVHPAPLSRPTLATLSLTELLYPYDILLLSSICMAVFLCLFVFIVHGKCGEIMCRVVLCVGDFSFHYAADCRCGGARLWSRDYAGAMNIATNLRHYLLHARWHPTFFLTAQQLHKRRR